MSKGAYYLVRFAHPENLIPATESFEKYASVVRWDAVDGHVHMVLRTGRDADLSDDVSKITGMEELTRYDITDDGEDGRTRSAESSAAYVFIETEPSKCESVRNLLSSIDNVLWTSATKGGCDIVAIVQGKNFDAVEQVVNQRIRLIDGVVRLKHDRIIDLKQL